MGNKREDEPTNTFLGYVTCSDGGCPDLHRDRGLQFLKIDVKCSDLA